MLPTEKRLQAPKLSMSHLVFIIAWMVFVSRMAAAAPAGLKKVDVSPDDVFSETQSSGGSELVSGSPLTDENKLHAFNTQTQIIDMLNEEVQSLRRTIWEQAQQLRDQEKFKQKYNRLLEERNQMNQRSREQRSRIKTLQQESDTMFQRLASTDRTTAFQPTDDVEVNPVRRPRGCRGTDSRRHLKSDKRRRDFIYGVV